MLMGVEWKETNKGSVHACAHVCVERESLGIPVLVANFENDDIN